jgi:hypothetical protein
MARLEQSPEDDGAILDRGDPIPSRQPRIAYRCRVACSKRGFCPRS